MNIIKYVLAAALACSGLVAQVSLVRRLNDLSDVQTSRPPTDGDVLSYDSTTMRWTNSAAGAGVLNDAVYSAFVGGLTSSNLIDLTDLMVFTDPTGTSSYQIEVEDLFGGMALHDQTLYVDNTYGSDTTGTRGRSDRPYATFDAAMVDAQENDIIFLRPGTHITAGSRHGLLPTFELKSGQSVIGSGRGNTTLLWKQGGILGPTIMNLILSTPDDATVSNCYVGHLTLESDSTNIFTADGGKVNGLVLYGNNHMADNVRVLNCVGYTNGTAASEAFGIMVGSPNSTYATCSNSVVKDCIVDTTHYSGSEWANGTAIIVPNGANITVHGNSILTAGNALGVAYGGRDIKFLDNHIAYALRGMNSDTGLTNKNIEISRNYMHGIGALSHGIIWKATATTNLFIRDNFIDGFTVGMLITNAVAGGYVRDSIVSGNYIEAGTDVFQIAKVTNALFMANSVLGSASGSFTDCSRIWGGYNRSRAGYIYTNMVFDDYMDDLYVMGTLTATNAALVTPSVSGINLTGSGTVMLGGSGNLTYVATNRVPWTVAIFDDVQQLTSTSSGSTLADCVEHTGSGVFVFSSGGGITNPVVAGGTFSGSTNTGTTYANDLSLGGELYFTGGGGATVAVTNILGKLYTAGLTLGGDLTLPVTGARALFVDAGPNVVTIGTSAYIYDSLLDPDGTGALVFSSGALLTNVTLTTPKLGAFTATSGTVTNGLEVGALTVNTNITVEGTGGGTVTLTDGAADDTVVFTAGADVADNVYWDFSSTDTDGGIFYLSNTNVAQKANTGTGSVVLSSGSTQTNTALVQPSITWHGESYTQVTDTNYSTLTFFGGPGYTNSRLYLTMTGNVYFAYTTNRVSGNTKTVWIRNTGANTNALYFNSSFNLVGPLANGTTVTNGYVLSWEVVNGTTETNVYVSGQYTE